MCKTVKKKSIPSPQVLQRAAKSRVIQKVPFIETDLLEIEKTS